MNISNPRVGSIWVDPTTEEEYKVLDIYAPNEEPDTWVRYYNQFDTELTCRVAAFVNTFTQKS